MSDEKTIDAEVCKSLENVAATRAEQVGALTQSDSASEARGTRPTLLKGKTAVALDRGARSMAAAIIEAGGAPSTAHNPTANGFTLERVYADKDALFPNAPTDRTINEISKAKLVERLSDNPSDQLLVATYKTSGDAVLATGETEQDPQEARDMQECRYMLACRHLAAAMYYANLGARFGSERVMAALQRRLDEFLPNKSFAMDLDMLKQITERDGLDHLHTSTNRLLGNIIAGFGDAADYRRARERGFPLPSVPATRGRCLDRP